MHASRRGFFLGGVAIAAFTAAGPALAASGGDAFTVTGKRGTFLSQVKGRDFGIGKGGGSGSLGLADAMSQGRYQAARLHMPQTEAKISAMVAKLDAGWPYAKAEPPQVHVIGLDFYNAYSLPDNSIVVAFGLLEQAQSDDEVAFILAHELGHLRLGHFAKGAREARQAHLTSRMGELFVIGSAASAGVSNLRSGGNGVDAFNATAAERASATNDFLHFINSSQPQHSRAEEDEADSIGYDLATLAGYSADTASAKVFDTIQADAVKREAETKEEQSQFDQDLKSAVSPAAMQSLIGGSRPSTGDLLRTAGSLAQSVGRSRGSSDDEPKHRAPEERKKGIAQYSADAYPQGAPLRDEQTSWLQSVRGAPEYAQAKVTVAAVYRAMKARAAGDYPGAKAAITEAKRTSFGAAPVVLNEDARLHDDMGDGDGSDRLFRQAHQNPDQSIQGYVDHVRMLWRRGVNRPADEIISAGIRRFDNDEKPFMSLQIAVAKQAGRDDDVSSLLRRCQDYGDDALMRDCNLAAGRSSSSQHADAPHLPSIPFSIPGLPH
ncbi:MAG TPA: M48 family metalloprotease [Caulobacteraceae bacterium]|jgi:Zn-dependent protease with chaperone function